MKIEPDKVKVILATDCGSTTTKAILIEKVGDTYRQTHRGESPTTVEAPFEDVTLGVLNSTTEVGELAGRRLVDDDGKIIQPATETEGCDIYISTSSAGGGLQMMVAGVVRKMTAESAERAALGAGAIVMDVISANDKRKPYEQIQRIRELRPDMILISGGIDGGTTTHVVRLAELIAPAKPRPRLGGAYQLPIIYAGNKDAAEQVKACFDGDVDLTIVDNIRPVLERENLGPARDGIHDCFLEHVMAHAPGYSKLIDMTDAPIMPTPAAVGNILKTIAEKQGINAVCVDIGGATTDVFSVFDGTFNRTVSANLGMSYSISNVCAEATLPSILRWVHFYMDERSLRNRVKNKMIRPTTIPQSLEELIFEQAVAREALRLAYVQHKSVATTLLEMILTGSFLERPGLVQNIELTAVVVLGFLTIILVPLLGATYTLLFAVGSMAAMAGTSWYFYVEKQILVDAVYPSIAGLLMYMSLTYMNYIREEAQKKQVRDAFSMYMSPALVEQLAEDPKQLKLGGEMRDMTLLFCDIRGFTTISEQFDPGELTSFINRFLTPMTDVILDRQGTIDKYMGDCIMAFWNAPLDDDDHARHGCASALAMLEACAKLNDEVKAEAEENNRKYIPVRVGLGLNSDTVCVGNMGSEQRFDYSVLGDGVNLAARLEGQSKTYGVDVVIGEGTKIAAPEFAIIELDLIQVKGKTKPARIFGLLGGTDMAQSDGFIRFAERHATMLEDYRAQRWDEAAVGAAECRDMCQPYNAEGLYDLFDERIAAFRADPPDADWTGVFIATSK